MQQRFKRAWWAVLMVALVGGLASIASAHRLAFSEATFVDTPTATFEDSLGEFKISCPITLEGSFHSRTISKVSGSVVGEVLKEKIAETSCTGEGEVGIEETFTPYRFEYTSFEGTLPNITGVKFNIQQPFTWRNRYARFLFQPCLYRFMIGDSTHYRTSGGRYIEEVVYRLVQPSPRGCPGLLLKRFEGPLRNPSRTQITITLVA